MAIGRHELLLFYWNWIPTVTALRSPWSGGSKWLGILEKVVAYHVKYKFMACVTNKLWYNMTGRIWCQFPCNVAGSDWYLWLFSIFVDITVCHPLFYDCYANVGSLRLAGNCQKIILIYCQLSFFAVVSFILWDVILPVENLHTLLLMY